MPIPNYAVILDDEIDPDSPITSSLMFRLRDNPLALFGIDPSDPSPSITLGPSQLHTKNTLQFSYEFYQPSGSVTQTEPAQVVYDQGDSVRLVTFTNGTISCYFDIVSTISPFDVTYLTRTYTLNIVDFSIAIDDGTGLIDSVDLTTEPAQATWANTGSHALPTGGTWVNIGSVDASGGLLTTATLTVEARVILTQPPQQLELQFRYSINTIDADPNGVGRGYMVAQVNGAYKTYDPDL